MKKLLLIYIVYSLSFLGAGICFSGCKKTTENLVTTSSDVSDQDIIASDELKVNNEMDQLIDEAVAGLGICKPTSGDTVINPYSIANTVIDTSQVDSGIVTLFYYGKEANNPNKSRKGNVEIKLPVVSNHVVPWSTPGVTATIIIPNNTSSAYEVFYNTQQTITLWFSGTFTVTNVSGGLSKNMVPGDSLVEQVRGPISYTSNDNSAILTLYTWNFCKTRVFNRVDANTLTITTRGDTTINGYTNVSNWGETRFGQTYYTSITIPVVRDTALSIFYNPQKGAKAIQNIPEPITDTLGVNRSGTPIISGVPYGYKINWNNASAGAQVSVVSY